MENIDIYYQSLKQVYDQILEWHDRKEPLGVRVGNWIIGVAMVAFLISLIPVLPTILTFVGRQTGLVLGPVDFAQATLGGFLAVWLLLTAGTLLFLMLVFWLVEKMFSAVKPGRPQQRLSPEQVTFLAIYEAYRELKVFFVSHVDQHVNNSFRALIELTPSARDRVHLEERLRRRRLRPEEVEMVYHATGPVTARSQPMASFPRQVLVAREFLRTFEKYAWFQLDPETRSTLQAIVSFSHKVLPRLRSREDLPVVLSILEDLSRFLYAYLPEHQANMNLEALEQLHAEGAECLDRFVKEVNDLTQYAPEQIKPETEQAPVTIWTRVQGLYKYNVFFRFVVWFVGILLVTSGIVFLASQRIQQLDPNVMVSMVVGTSATAAAAMAAFTPRTPKYRPVEEDKNEAVLAELESTSE